MAAMADMAGSRQQLLEQDAHIGLRLERIVVAKLLACQCVLLAVADPGFMERGG